MLRYLRRLQAKDIALDRSMIPLGSCTMKLNATAEMIPVTWPGFANLHPFAPADQAAGYQQLFRDLEASGWPRSPASTRSRSSPTPAARASMPASWSIRAWHEQPRRGAPRRLPDPLLRPRHQPGQRRHGRHAGRRRRLRRATATSTSPTSRAKADAARRPARGADGHLPQRPTACSRPAIKDICGVVHEHGGQVYMDGANLNALVGIARPAEFGADVCHINLHKTFCIPHGGGGPGMGPIGVKAHLAPFLPDHPRRPGRQPLRRRARASVPVAAAPWGSASILPISWAYIAMMGGEGLTRATRGGDPERQLRRHAASRPITRSSTPARTAWWRTSASSTSARIKERDRHHRRGRRQAPRRLRLPRAHHVVARARDDDDRADREREPGRARPLLRGDDRDPRGDPGDRAGRGGPRRTTC